MLNFTLANAFIFYIAATSWGSCSLVFCSKVVLRLALVHSKYTGNREITVISIRRWMKSLLLSFPLIVCRKHRFWKRFYLTKVVLKIFGKFTGKIPWPLLQPLTLKKILLTGVFLGIFQTFLRTATFIKHFWAAVSVFPSTT